MLKTTRIIVTAALLFLPVGTIHAEQRSVFGLHELQIEALQRNPALRQRAQAVRAAEGQVRQARLYPNPELELEQDDLRLDRDMGMTSAAVGQPLILSGRRERETAWARRRLEAARAEFAMAVRETLTQVDRVHVQLLYHQADVASQFALLAEAEATLEAAEARRSIDPSGEQHYRKARIERDRILFEVTRHSAEGLYTLQDMMVLLGGLRLRSDQITGALSTDYAVTSGKTDLVSIHPRLRAARAAAEAEEAMLAFRRREWQPDVTVRVGVGWREESDETVPFAGIRMPLPIWNRNQGAIAEGRALVLRAESYVEEVELDLENAVRFNLQQLSEYDTFVHEYRTQIKPDAQAALVETRTRFSAGEASHLELLDSQRVYTAARDTYFAFLLQYNLQLAERRGLEGYEAEALAADFLLNGSPNPRQRK